MLLAPDVAAAERRRGFAWIAAAYLAAFLSAVAVAWDLRGRDVLWTAAAADLAATVVVFGFSVALENSSVYDPYRSVAPIPIVLGWWWTSARAGSPAWRQALVVALVVAWGARRTVHWARRWHGLTDEDFRYVELRARAGRWYWPVSLLGIHLMPTTWVFLGLLPAYVALVRPERPFEALDAIGVAVAVAAIAIESVADLQLRLFRARTRDPGALPSTGPWAWSRHPDCFGELLFWWGLFLLGLSARPSSAWIALGPLAITLVFAVVGVPMTERRMRSRHAAWAAHARRPSALVPWPPRRGGP
jgi:steroid 5-alpha reductase family enzyme